MASPPAITATWKTHLPPGPILGEKLIIANHVPAHPDVYQNIGKNSKNLCRGNCPEFDGIMRWGSSANQQELQALFDYTCARIVLLKRPVMPMPDLDVPRLTFYRVGALLDELLATPSAGAHEQFAVAAFLGALVEEFGAAGLAGLRVDTKNLNASDASSRTAGNVEVRHGNRLVEAFEVSANDWRSKLDQAKRAIRSADLKRLYVIASVRERLVEEMTELGALDANVSVVDVRQFLRGVAGILQKTRRRDALTRLYELLERRQPNIDLVNA